MGHKNRNIFTTRKWVETEDTDDYGDPIEGYWGDEIILSPAAVQPRRISTPNDGQKQYSSTEVVAYWSDILVGERLEPEALSLQVGQEVVWTCGSRSFGTYKVATNPREIRNEMTMGITYRVELVKFGEVNHD